MSKPTIAIMGLSGTLGQPMLKELQSPLFRGHYSLPIKAIGRDTSKYTNTEDVVYISASSDEPENLCKALEGTDVLVDLTSGGNYKNTVDTAIKLGIKVYFPPIYSAEYEGAPEFREEFRFKGDILEICHSKKDQLKTVELLNGFFADWQLTNPFMIGASIQDLSISLMGKGESKIAHTFVSDIVKTIASLAYRPASELPDKVRVYGELITQKEFIEVFEKNTGKKLKVTVVPVEEVRKRAQEAQAKIAVNEGAFPWDEMFKIVTSLYADRSNVFDFTGKDHKELVNPGETLWKWKKISETTPEEWTA